MTINWITDSQQLPPIAQDVLFLHPHGEEFFKVEVACILVAHEGVTPCPPGPYVRGRRWSPDFWWSIGGPGGRIHGVVGSCWWAPLTEITLPPIVEHRHIHGFDCIVSAARGENQA